VLLALTAGTQIFIAAAQRRYQMMCIAIIDQRSGLLQVTADRVPA
jgi:hypothetical protein